MTLEKRLSDAVREVGDRLVVPEVDLDSVRSQARANRRRAVSMAVVAAVVAIVVVGTSLVGRLELGAPAPARPEAPPNEVVAGAVPVWYDAAGLHRGGIVEPTPVELLPPDSDTPEHGLALVRTGALYRDPATDDVWFHPWGGEPRVVGRALVAGPAGDVEGDLAAWFEGRELVLYDTALDRVLSRTVVAPVVGRSGSGHDAGDNGFLHVSATEVVWRSGGGSSPSAVHSLDVATGTASLLWHEPPSTESERALTDVHDATRVWRELKNGQGHSTLVELGGGEEMTLDGWELVGSLSADGRLLLSATGAFDVHGAAIADVRLRRTWQLPVSGSYVWGAWSYDDVAVVAVTRNGEMGPLLSCRVVSRSCEQLSQEGGILLPTT